MTTWFHATKKFSNSKYIFSLGSRLTLLKSVLNSFGIFYMSLFKMLESVLDALENLRYRFFWGENESERKISWVKWRPVLNDKDKGGLGIDSLKALTLLFS